MSTDKRITGLVLHLPVAGYPRISQPFGSNSAIYKQFGLAGHEGIDFACPTGTAVMAASNGKVWRAGDSKGPWGTRVILQHSFGFTVYAHLSSVWIPPGRGVMTGQLLGYSGATGNVTGPHLHFCLALPQENPGYACPAVMGNFWWHDPLSVGDALFSTRAVGPDPVDPRTDISMACCLPAFTMIGGPD